MQRVVLLAPGPVAVLVWFLAACRGDNAPAAAAPMPPEMGIRMGVAQSYSFMHAAFIVGDAVGYARNFSDSAKVYVPGYEPMVGRDAIATGFGLDGTRRGVTDFQRTPDGHRVEGREVVDSGRYEVAAEPPLPPGVLGAVGRYWTRWRYTDDGQWIVLFDSLAIAR